MGTIYCHCRYRKPDEFTNSQGAFTQGALQGRRNYLPTLLLYSVLGSDQTCCLGTSHCGWDPLRVSEHRDSLICIFQGCASSVFLVSSLFVDYVSSFHRYHTLWYDGGLPRYVSRDPFFLSFCRFGTYRKAVQRGWFVREVWIGKRDDRLLCR